MSKGMETITFSVENESNQGRAGKVSLPVKERRRRGFRAALPFWLGAIPCLFIPLLHYILVPLLLVLGFLQARSYWKVPFVYVQGKVDCPRCQKPLSFGELPVEVPLKVLCEGCGYQLRLREVSPA